jgi:hypothetical protein
MHGPDPEDSVSPSAPARWARAFSAFQVVVNFRRSGWRRPLGDFDEVELWTGTTCLARLPGALVSQVLAHHVLGLFVQADVQTVMTQTAEAESPWEKPRLGEGEAAPPPDPLVGPAPTSLPPSALRLQEALDNFVASLEARGDYFVAVAPSAARLVAKLFPEWLTRPVAELGQVEVDAFRRRCLEEGLAATTARNYALALRRALGLWRRRNRWDQAPTRRRGGVS